MAWGELAAVTNPDSILRHRIAAARVRGAVALAVS
jgi:hypothetical protein